jgi:hypothetical protein
MPPAFPIPVAAYVPLYPPAPSATSEVAAVVGHWYHWVLDANAMIPMVGGASFAQGDADTGRCFPLVVPFDGTWDTVQILTNSPQATDRLRLALYAGEPTTGNRPMAAGGLLTEVLFPAQTVINVNEYKTAAVALTLSGGTVVWAYMKRHGIGAAQNLLAMVYDAASASNPGSVFGFGDPTANSPGTSICALVSPNATFGNTAAFGAVPVDPFTAPLWTDQGAGVSGIPIIRFHLAAL